MNSKRVVLPALCILLACAPAESGSEFEKWKHQQLESFQQYKDERDKAFAAFLEQHWRAIELEQGVVRDRNPKPVVAPIATPQAAQPTETIAPPSVKPQPRGPETPAPVIPKPRPGVSTEVDYFGTLITFYYDPAFQRAPPGRVTKTAVSNFWSAQSKTDYQALIQQLDAQAKALRLDDWGYALLVHRLAMKIHPLSKNNQALFCWFMLSKAGYDSRIAYSEDRVYLLLAAVQRMYDVTYFTFGKERYYAVSFDGSRHRPGQVYTYDGQYPGAVKKLDMVIRTRAARGNDAHKRDLSFDYGGKRYVIEASYQPSRVDYLNTYPQLDLELYFKSEVGEVAESPLLQQLAAIVDDMEEVDAVNFLLRFVQSAWQYQTDEQQFGAENSLFPEETIYYPYSDCEDRSVLFTWLVSRLLGLDVIGLNYPGHVAAAVHLDQDVAGEHVIYNGKKFLVTDPTYINAMAGMAMPGYEHMKPGVIPVR